MDEGFKKEQHARQQVQSESVQGFKHEENARQLVQKELAIMKDEIKNLISVHTLLVVHSVEGGVRTQSQFLFKFCKLNVQSLHGVSFAVVFVSTSLIW